MMATYAIEFVKSARKDFEKLPARIRERIVEALTVLSLNPYSELLKVKKLKGAELFRIRLGDYRVVYEVRKKQLVVVVIKVVHRSEVYRK